MSDSKLKSSGEKCSHSSTEVEMISLDAGLRMDGIPACFFWDTVVDLLEPMAQGDLMRKRQQNTQPTTKRTHFQKANIAFREDNEAVIKISLKARVPN